MVLDVYGSQNVNQAVGNIIEGKFDRIKRLPGYVNLHSYDDTTIGIIGLGGIGYHIAKSIAMTLRNVEMTLIDHEKVEDVNLNRFDIDPLDIGRYKVDVAADMLTTLNPTIRVVPFNGKLQDYIVAANMHFDLCINETDNPEVDKLIYERCHIDNEGVYLSVKYDGLREVTVHVNSIGFSSGVQVDPYTIMPSFYPSAVIAANILTLLMTKYDLDELARMKKVYKFDIFDMLKV